MEKKKSVKLGAILTGKNGPFMVLGNSKNKDPRYNYSVEFRVKDNEGNVIHSGKNPIVSMFAPKHETKVVQHELVVFTEDGNT